MSYGMFHEVDITLSNRKDRDKAFIFLKALQKKGECSIYRLEKSKKSFFVSFEINGNSKTDFEEIHKEILKGIKGINEYISTEWTDGGEGIYLTDEEEIKDFLKGGI